MPARDAGAVPSVRVRRPTRGFRPPTGSVAYADHRCKFGRPLLLGVVCFLLVSGFWFWVLLLVSGLAVPTGAVVTVAELFLNSVQQCSFFLLLGCCSCVAVFGGLFLWCGSPARSTRHQTPISGHHWPSPGHRLKTPPDGGDLDRFRPIFFPTLNAHGLVVLACDLWVFSSNIHAGIQ